MPDITRAMDALRGRPSTDGLYSRDDVVAAMREAGVGDASHDDWWMTMRGLDTAPRDGKRVILEVRDLGEITAYFDAAARRWKCVLFGDDICDDSRALGWFPLPAHQPSMPLQPANPHAGMRAGMERVELPDLPEPIVIKIPNTSYQFYSSNGVDFSVTLYDCGIECWSKSLIDRFLGELDAAVTAASDLPTDDGWSYDMDAAPRDDTELLVNTKEHGQIKARWTPLLSKWIMQWGLDDWIEVYPTHYRPLPAPPKGPAR